jgi:hypothetical protein
MKKLLLAVLIVLMISTCCCAAPTKKSDENKSETETIEKSVKTKSKAKKPEIQKIEKGKYARVALLVSRMGGYLPSEISLETNYAEPLIENIKKLNLRLEGFYIEDNSCLSRLKEVYPLMSQIKRGGLLAFLDETFYYRNITPEITNYLSKWLSEKGYQVIDVNEISRHWDKRLYEMSIKDIASNFKDYADLLLVFHYTDHGNRNYNDQRTKLMTKGLSIIAYNFAGFDLTSKERVLMFAPQTMLSVYHVMLSDPEIKSDPALKEKIKIVNSPKADFQFERGLWERSRTSVVISGTQATSFDGFTEEEIIRYAIRYIINGFSLHSFKNVGLDQVIE